MSTFTKMHVGVIMNTLVGVRTLEGYHEYPGGLPSVHQGITFSTLEGAQYTRGFLSIHRGLDSRYFCNIESAGTVKLMAERWDGPKCPFELDHSQHNH